MDKYLPYIHKSQEATDEMIGRLAFMLDVLNQCQQCRPITMTEAQRLRLARAGRDFADAINEIIEAWSDRTDQAEPDPEPADGRTLH